MAENSDDPDFDDIAPKSVTKRIGGKDHVVREASAGVATQYRNATTRAIRMTDAKVSGIDNIADAELLLASLCTFEAKAGGGEVAVPVEGIKQWPDRVVQWIVAKVKEMSPSLETKVTVESIDKQIARLNRQRAKLIQEPEDEGDLGKG